VRRHPAAIHPTQSRKRKRGTKKILTFDQMSLVFFRVSHSHVRMNKKFFFSFFFSLRKMYFSDAPKDALSQTLCRHSPRKKRSSSITPSFSPPFDSFMHQLLYIRFFPSSLSVYFTTHNTLKLAPRSRDWIE
jgi:hypothetical protein